tara:strand:+ start:1094 stop:3349 length:2256 start_codon:yes stop_codon:yes gene_type:complete
MPANGTACGFLFHSFSFGGHLQRWTYKESLSGRFYDVTLESPAKLLDGVQVILSDFETGYNELGGRNVLTTQVRNVWNPFAECEAYGYGGTFGDSGNNSAGMPVWTLFPKLALFGSGGGYFGGKIKFGESEYTMDFSELFNIVLARAPYYRVKGPVQSVSAILSDLAEVAQVDYFVQCRASNNGAIANPELKVQIADRAFVQGGVIEAYVASAKGTGVVVSANSGEELNDVATGKVLIGGPASRYYEAPVEAGVSAFSVWGSTGNNASFLLGGPASVEYSNINAQVPVILDEFSGIASYIANIFELRMALGGQQVWETFKVFQMISGNEPNGYTLGGSKPGPFMGAMEANQTTLSLLFQGKRDAIDMAVTSAKSVDKAYQKAAKDLQQTIFAGVSRVASNFFGQVFMVPLPYEAGGIDNNLRFIADDVQYEASWEISESAWTRDKPIPDWNFYDGEGKLKSCATFPVASTIDYSPLGGDFASTAGGGIATGKGGPDKDLFWIYGKPYCIARAGAQLRNYDSLTTPDFGLTVLAYLFFGINVPPERYIGPGKQSVQISIPPAIVLPTSIGVPQESARYTWGPWYAFSADNGKAEVEIDASMRPETFGNSFLMDQSGFGSVFSGLARLGAVESGSIELAQEPQFNMGDRFNAVGPYVTSMDISIGVDGYKTNYKFSTWTPNFGKLSKYNADRLSRVNKAGIALAKSERGKTNKRPFPKMKFEKTDFSAKMANGGQRFDNRDGMEVMNGMFKTL